jgi:hypothetical protein
MGDMGKDLKGQVDADKDVRHQVYMESAVCVLGSSLFDNA